MKSRPKPMSNKMNNATVAGLKRSVDDDGSNEMSEKKPKLTDLPADALASIVDLACHDMNRVLELASSNKHFMAVIQKWKCSNARCNNSIFVTIEGDDGKMELTYDA